MINAKWFYGVACSLVSSLFLALAAITNSAVIKKHKNVFGLGVVRSLMQASVIVPLITYKKVSFVGKASETKLLIVETLLETVLQMVYFLALSYVPAMDAAAITYSYPVIVCMVAHFFNGTTFQKRYVFTAVVAVIGALLICQPSFIFRTVKHFKDERYVGYLLSLLSAVLFAAVAICNDMLKETSPMTLAFLTSVAPGLAYGISALITRVRIVSSCGMESVWFVLSGILNQFGNLFFFVAYKYCDSKLLSVVGILQTPMVIILDTLLLGSTLSWLSIIGVVLNLAAVLLCLLFCTDSFENAWLRVLRFCKSTANPVEKTYDIYTIYTP